MPQTIRLIVFPGGFNWPIWAAQENGFFAREGLELAITPTASSMQMMQELVAGKHDIAMTAIDNVIAYQEGQGEAEIDRAPDLFAFMGGDHGFLRLVVQKDIRTYDDLRGKTLSVDAMTTGYAFVLRKLLERAGLKDGDYKLERAGGVMQRWEALKEGKHAGTLLITPFDIIGEKLGLRTLDRAEDVFPQYQGLVGATTRRWAKDHEGELVGYVRAYLAGLDWLFDPANRQAAIDLLIARVPNMQPDVAAKVYDTFITEKGGFERKARINREGIRTVLGIRGDLATPKKSLSGPDAYDDLRYYERATAGA